MPPEEDKPFNGGSKAFETKQPQKDKSSAEQGKLDPKEAHQNEVEKDLIKKAQWIVMITVFFLFVIVLVDIFSEKSGTYTSDLISLFGTIVTFVLGYLFGTSRSK